MDKKQEFIKCKYCGENLEKKGFKIIKKCKKNITERDIISLLILTNNFK